MNASAESRKKNNKRMEKSVIYYMGTSSILPTTTTATTQKMTQSKTLKLISKPRKGDIQRKRKQNDMSQSEIAYNNNKKQNTHFYI